MSFQSKSISPVSSGGLNVLKTGGSLTLAQRFKETMQGIMSWKIAAFIVFAIILVVFAYYTYKQYAVSKTAFHANRENVPKGENSNKTATLMLFYVDWCPHCKTAKPEWESLKAEYDGKMINGYTINFMDYNCTNESPEITQLMDKYSIEGYPTIKLVKDNQIIEYDAKPSKSTMEQFLNTVL